MGKDSYSREGFFGEIIHYDSKGHKIGESRPGFFGGYNNYDNKGHKIGETRPGFFGYNTYDNHGHKTGSSSPGLFGTNHYDSSGHNTGTTIPSFTGTKTYGNGDTDFIGNASAAAAMERDPAFASWGAGEYSGKTESSFLHQACAAPMITNSMEGMSESEYRGMFYNRIVGVLKSAAYSGYEDLVLGAWGCGAFGNDAAIVSNLFDRALKELNWAGLHAYDLFNTIVFAIRSRGEESYNYKEFNRNFRYGNT